MGMTLIFCALVLWILYMTIKFYRRAHWEDDPEAGGPDLAQMRKRDAELLHIQDVLHEAQAQGKLSAEAVKEFDRFYEAEAADMKRQQTEWAARRSKIDSTVD